MFGARWGVWGSAGVVEWWGVWARWDGGGGGVVCDGCGLWCGVVRGVVCGVVCDGCGMVWYGAPTVPGGINRSISSATGAPGTTGGSRLPLLRLPLRGTPEVPELLVGLVGVPPIVPPIFTMPTPTVMSSVDGFRSIVGEGFWLR